MRKWYQGSAKERGTEGAACLRQDYLMVCRYLIRISKYTQLTTMTTCNGSLFNPQVNLGKEYLLSLECLLSLFLYPLPSSPTLGIHMKLI